MRAPRINAGIKTWTLLIALGCLGQVTIEGTNDNEDQAKEFISKVNSDFANLANIVNPQVFHFHTNITKYNEQELVNASTILAQFNKDFRAHALKFKASVMSKDVQRQLKKITHIGVSAEPNITKVEELGTLVGDMETIYSRAKVCLTPQECIPLEPDITRLMFTSRDYDKLKTVWVGWRNETGRKMRDGYAKFVELSNEAIRYAGYNDTGEEWRSQYESKTFVQDVQKLFDQVRPLYEQLHAYVRKRLKQYYGEKRFPKSGHIPAHILGDLWGQEWSGLADLTIPFANKSSINVTREMLRQNYTVEKIFRTAEDFFVSLGFDKMVPSFWTLSMLEKPKDGHDVMCHASAWDFHTGKDFRIMMCTDITQRDLMVAHHEMGHIAYYMQTMHQPYVYQDGANPGFHEAVGDVAFLSVQTPEHMKQLGLINELPTDNEGDINFLMSMALQKVPFLPLGFLIDQWRWSVFSGQTTPATYNKDWWDLRCRLHGLSPPLKRTEEDFDPGAKFHVAAGIPYIRYFVSFIIQFQFHKALCQAAGHTGPLHRCDIYNSKRAGQKLRDMLKLGSSKPWPVAMKQITGQKKMDAQPLLEYFKPLLDFLKAQNGKDFGWEPNCPVHFQ